MKTRYVPLLLLMAFVANLCIAGSIYTFKCTTPTCKFQGSIEIGGGFGYGKVTGFCTTCKKFVSIRWETKSSLVSKKKNQDKANGLPKGAPKKVGSVWTPASGIPADLYSCPHCRKLFKEINPVELGFSPFEEVFCPHCREISLKFENTGNAD